MNAYTYLIGWKLLNIWYYGVRFAKGCHPTDLWNPYKTSSKYVLDAVNKFGNPDIIQVRRQFKNSADARKWENRVLRRMKVIYDNKWLNKTNNISIEPMYGLNNPATKIETREKISKNTPKKIGDSNPMKNPITANKVSKKLKGRQNYWQIGESNPAKRPEVRKILSELKIGEKNGFYNKKHSIESIEKIKRKVTCTHCNKEGSISIMKRWHFDNCRKIK